MSVPQLFYPSLIPFPPFSSLFSPFWFFILLLFPLSLHRPLLPAPLCILPPFPSLFPLPPPPIPSLFSPSFVHSSFSCLSLPIPSLSHFPSPNLPIPLFFFFLRILLPFIFILLLFLYLFFLLFFIKLLPHLSILLPS